MHIVRTYSSRRKLEGKPEGRRVNLIPENLAEAVVIAKFYKRKKFSPKTVLYQKFNINGDEGEIRSTVSRYIPDSRVPILRFRLGDTTYTNLVRRVEDIALKADLDSSQSRTDTTIEYSPEVLENKWEP